MELLQTNFILNSFENNLKTNSYKFIFFMELWLLLFYWNMLDFDTLNGTGYHVSVLSTLVTIPNHSRDRQISQLLISLKCVLLCVAKPDETRRICYLKARDIISECDTGWYWFPPAFHFCFITRERPNTCYRRCALSLFTLSLTLDRPNLLQQCCSSSGAYVRPN